MESLASAAAAGTSASSLLNNQIVLSGIVLLLAGGLMAYARTALVGLLENAFQKLFVTVEISQREEAYDWVLQWLAQQPETFWSSRNYSLLVEQSLGPLQRFRKAQRLEVVSREPPKLKYLAGHGLHTIWHKGHLLWLVKSRRKDLDINTNIQGHFQAEPGGVLTITTWGRSKDAVDSLIQEAMESSWKKDRGSTIVYNIDSSYGGWKRAITRPERSIESVILDTDLAEELVLDAKEFLSSAEWYNSLGIPYRRTYLFYGEPGCGKTSFVAALAAKLNYNVCVLNLSDKNMNDSSLNLWLVEAPQNAIILLEDVDVAFVNQDRTKKDREKNPYEVIFGSNRSVTFSGLLNAIDGIASQMGRIFIMTTNHMELLDPALIRPGRVDKKVNFGLASINQIYRMFVRFFPHEAELARQFSDKVGPTE